MMLRESGPSLQNRRLSNSWHDVPAISLGPMNATQFCLVFCFGFADMHAAKDGHRREYVEGEGGERDTGKSELNCE